MVVIGVRLSLWSQVDRGGQESRAQHHSSRRAVTTVSGATKLTVRSQLVTREGKGLVTLASAIAMGDFLAGLMKGSRIGEIVRESFTIGGWVSMWRPLEVFLYDWWPIRDEARLSDRLAAMPVRIRYLNAKEPDAWRGDWPAVSPRGERATSEAQPRTLNQAS